MIMLSVCQKYCISDGKAYSDGSIHVHHDKTLASKVRTNTKYHDIKGMMKTIFFSL